MRWQTWLRTLCAGLFSGPDLWPAHLDLFSRSTMLARGCLRRLPPQPALARGFRATAAAREEYDVVIVGGGPGGYVAAIKASQLGLKTVRARPPPSLTFSLSLARPETQRAALPRVPRARRRAAPDRVRIQKSRRARKGVRGVARFARRHLPQCRLHPVQGAAALVAPLPRGPARFREARHQALGRGARPRRDDVEQGEGACSARSALALSAPLPLVPLSAARAPWHDRDRNDRARLARRR